MDEKIETDETNNFVTHFFSIFVCFYFINFNFSKVISIFWQKINMLKPNKKKPKQTHKFHCFSILKEIEKKKSILVVWCHSNVGSMKNHNNGSKNKR